MSSNGGFTVYNFSTALGTGPSAAGCVVVNRRQDVILPSGRQQFSVKRVGCTRQVQSEKITLLLCQVECINTKY